MKFAFIYLIHTAIEQNKTSRDINMYLLNMWSETITGLPGMYIVPGSKNKGNV